MMRKLTSGERVYTCRYNGYSITYQAAKVERRTELIAQDNRKRNAAAALKNIKPADVNVMYADKEVLVKELARMRADLDAAQALVEAI
jgi:ubiquitin